MNTLSRNSRMLWSFVSKASVILTLIVFIVGCAQQRKPIEGAWKLVYAKSVTADTSVWQFPGDYMDNQMKIWVDDHWAFIGKAEWDTSSTTSFGGGTYTLEGNHYYETILYHSSESIIDTTLGMLLEIKGDSLTQTWQSDKGNFYIEKYIRLK